MCDLMIVPRGADGEKPVHPAPACSYGPLAAAGISYDMRALPFYNPQH